MRDFKEDSDEIKVHASETRVWIGFLETEIEGQQSSQTVVMGQM